MKAATYHKYGPPQVVSITDIPRPEPSETDVLIRVHASTVSAGDWRLRSLTMPRGMRLAGRLFAGPFGPRQPVLGTEVSGVIVDKGEKADGWQIGDAVIAYPGAKMGGHAEYITMPASGNMVKKPAGLSFAEAAAIPFGGTTALDFLCDKAMLQTGERVLIVGASGATGSAAVQIAHHLGAHVTGVCSAKNAELVLSLGAEKVIDYTAEDFAARTEQFDMIVDTTSTAPWKRVKRMLTPKGRLVIISGTAGDMLRSLFSKRMIGGVAAESAGLLQRLMGIIEDGGFFPLIDRIYPFEHIVNAHTHVDTGRKKGAVVVSMLPEAPVTGQNPLDD